MAKGASNSWPAPGALLAVASILAGSSSAAYRSDKALLAGAAFVSLRAHQSVPAGVARNSASTTGAVLTVETWQTPQALKRCVTSSTTQDTHTQG